MVKQGSHQDILSFWFTEISTAQWFKKDATFDVRIKDRFSTTVEGALLGRRDHWAEEAESALALILLLDQFTRNIFRDTPRAFVGDGMALALSFQCVARDYLSHPNDRYRQFMLMPMMHSEDLIIQDASLPLFEAHTNPQSHEYAIKHRDIIARFGRFPHRNAIFGRPSSEEEQAFLKQPGSSF